MVLKALKMTLTAVLLFSFLLVSCACGSADYSAGEANDSEKEESTVRSYTVTIIDDDNQPVSGVLLQLCLESCFPNKTNAAGMAQFTSLPVGDYKVSLLSLPDGYDYATEEREWYFPDGESELTITLDKAS